MTEEQTPQQPITTPQPETQTPPPPPPQPPYGGAPIQPERKGHGCLWGGLACGGVVAIGVLVLMLVGVLFSGLRDFVDTASFPASLPKPGGAQIGLLEIKGVMMDSADTLKVAEHYRKDQSLRGVLVRIESPGGSVGTSQEIYEAILSLRESGKTVIVSMGNVAASGGYYAAIAGEKVYTNPGTLTGSIGVIMSLPDFQKISDKIGIGNKTIKSGRFKDTPSTMRDLAPTERVLLEGVINDTYNQFINAILDQRRQPLEEARERWKTATADTVTSGPLAAVRPNPGESVEDYLRSVADGRVMTGQQALEYGLVDALGTKDDALNDLAKRLGIAKPKVYEYKVPHSLFEMLESGAQSTLGILPDQHGARLEYRMNF